MNGRTARNGSAASAPQRQDDLSVELARRILGMRRLRDRLLGDFFAEPAWDILLDLYAQTHEGETVTVSQLSLATGAPPTTALRWINTLADAGLLIRRADEADARRVLVSLSPRGEQGVRQLLASVLQELEVPLGGAAGGAKRGAAGRKPARPKSLRSRCETSPSSSTPSSTQGPETAS